MTTEIPKPTEHMSMLTKRRIEAEILGHVYEVLKAQNGKEAAMQVIGEAVRKSAIQQGKQFASESTGGTSLQGFVELSRHWLKEDALQMEVREATPTEWRFDVVRCKYSEMYREMGLSEIGHLLSCQRDAMFNEGYDPKLKLTRTQTLMQGASHCNFLYTYDSEPSADAASVK
jgi:hypothetical protein